MHSYELLRLRVSGSSPGFVCDSVRMAAVCGGKRSRRGTGSDEPARSLFLGGEVKEAFTFITKWQKQATIYLMEDCTVGFETNAGQCADPHGFWVALHSSIKVHFHFKGQFAKINEHVFVKLEQTDAYLLDNSWSDNLAWMLPHTRQQEDKGPRDDAADDVEEEASSVEHAADDVEEEASKQRRTPQMTTGSCSLACAKIYLLRDNRVVLQQKNGISTKPHGSWLVAPDGSLILVFHYEGEFRKIKEHEFRKLTCTSAYELDTAAPDWLVAISSGTRRPIVRDDTWLRGRPSGSLPRSLRAMFSAMISFSALPRGLRAMFSAMISISALPRSLRAMFSTMISGRSSRRNSLNVTRGCSFPRESGALQRLRIILV
jgi:hypothetical protein